MRVSVFVDKRFYVTADGGLWTDVQYTHSFWRRYLTIFDEVTVVARTIRVNGPSPDWERIDGSGVRFVALPNYRTPLEYVQQYACLRKQIAKIVEEPGAIILRTPVIVGGLTRSVCARAGKPFAVEVIADPHLSLSRGSVKHPLRPLLRRWSSISLRRQCTEACAAAYVTEHTLQRKYPCNGPQFALSDVELLPTEMVSLRSQHSPVAEGCSQRKRLVTVVSLAHRSSKGVDTLLRAMRRCLDGGADLELTILGDGRSRNELERLRDKLGLAKRVKFTGQVVSRPDVLSYLANSDMFVLASRAEGLPRALVEAMACGLPCIASSVGGIPELLPPHSMVPPGNPRLLSDAIQSAFSDPQLLKRMADENYRRVLKFRQQNLEEIRKTFLSLVRDATKAIRHESRISIFDSRESVSRPRHLT
jgi:glycosyltransferase involved in cell wall biosynthesis